MRWITFTLTLLLTLASNAQEARYAAEPSGEFLRTWLLAGPFPAGTPVETTPDLNHLSGFDTDFLASAGGEAKVGPATGDTVSFNGDTVTWKVHTSEEDAIGLDGAVSNADEVVAYAACTIVSPEPTTTVLALGSNDGAKVWFNGDPVWDTAVARGLRMDEDLIPLVLREGDNTLLIKIEERGNLWEFAARLLPMDHPLLGEKLDLFEIVQEADGKPVLRFQHSSGFLKQLENALQAKDMERIRFAAYAETAPEEVVWQKEWKGQASLPIDVPTDQYERYALRISGTFPGGLTKDAAIPFYAGTRIEHVLFDHGASTYQILVAQDASESEQWAAQELQHWLAEVSGATLAISNDIDDTSAPAILVGHNARAKKLLNGKYAPSGENDESFVWTNVGGDIVIAGGPARGTMYGVMDFLEENFGLRWYTPAVTNVPKKDRFVFARLHHTEAPGIRVRNDFYKEAFDPTWAARNRVNGAMGTREQVGGVEGYWAVHTFFPLMPPDEFFADHPEYYSLINGERRWDHAQLCLTNPDVERILTERLLQRMRDNPGNLIYSISQNDWRNPCQCDNCQAIVAHEESEAGPVVAIVNSIAEAVEQEFPDKYVGTLAYQYTRKPPKHIKPRENVVIRLCSIECCFSHPFTECPHNASFMDDLRGWAAIAPHMYIWDYVVNFGHYILPYPNFDVLQPNIQTLRDHNAIGIMEQGAYQSRGGEFAELRMYVLSRLLWDPNCDVEKVIDDFMYGYYGRAGQYVRAYFDLLHDQLTPDTHITLFMAPSTKIHSNSFIRKARTLFEQAERVADNPEILQRVEVAELPVLYLKCKRMPIQAREDGDYDKFTRVVEREGITHYAERGAAHREAFHQEVEAAK